METVKVYSPIEDKDIQKNLNDSPVWKKAIHADELEDVEKNYERIFEYDIKFDGTKPVQVTKISAYK